MPPNFPVQTMHAMRLLRVIAEDRPDLLRHATDLFWVSNFQAGAGEVTDIKTYPTLLADLKLPEAELRSLIEKSVSAPNKECVGILSAIADSQAASRPKRASSLRRKGRSACRG